MKPRSSYLRLGLAGAVVGAWLCFALVPDARATGRSAKVQAHCVGEIALTSERVYPDPFKGVTVDAVVTAPDGRQLRVPAFWAGNRQWRFRYSSGALGRHVYRTECSDPVNAQLHGVQGTIEVVPYRGNNPLYRHGPIQVAKDQRHFESADGTPFFWLGDTWWKGLSERLPWKGFQQLTADRKAKGFTVVQIVAGPLPDEPPFDARWANEGGMPYEKDYAQVNPAYFDYADRRLRYLIDAGITPAIVGGWGWHMPSVGVEKFNRHWRYLVARYAAYPVIWIIGGEAEGRQWTEVGRFLRQTDPYHRVATFHPYGSARRGVTDETVIDFDMLQTGHNDWGAAANTIAKVTAAYSKTPPMPVLIGEVDYEGHMMANRQDVQRYLFWSCLLNGAAGHTYGAGGIWQMNSATVRGAEYEFTPWYEAMRLPGATQLGQSKKLLEAYPWWRFTPHPEWVEPHGTTLSEPHEAWYNDKKEWEKRAGKYDLPYAAGIPGEVRFVFIPGNHFYAWQAPTVVHLESNVVYHAFFYDPVWSKQYDLGMLARPATESPFVTDSFADGEDPGWKDYGTPTERKEGHLLGKKGMLTVLEKIEETDAIASVNANGDAEAGILLRFQDADNYLVGLYSPSLKAIYFHNRTNGAWGPMLGKVAVPEVGPRIHLAAAVCGNLAALTLTDGKTTYATPNVVISRISTGKIGLWLYKVGDHQQYDHFELSRLQFKPPPSCGTLLRLVLRNNPGILEEQVVPPASMVIGDAYTPPRLPVPQDWVLVLERAPTPGTQ